MKISPRVLLTGWHIVIMIAMTVSLAAQDEERQSLAADACKTGTLQSYIDLTDGCTVGPITFKFDKSYMNMNGVEATKVNVEPVPSPPGLKFKFPEFKLPENEFAMMSFTGRIDSTVNLSSGQIATLLKDDAIFVTCTFQTPGGKDKTPDSSQISIIGRKYKLATGTYLNPVTKAKFKYELSVLESSEAKTVPATDFSGTFIPQK